MSGGSATRERKRSAPLSRATRNVGKSARIRGGPRSTIINHREYLVDVTGEEVFTWDQHIINPGLPTSFPWLSAIAQRFETYRFRKLAFRYVPRCSATTAGSVMIICDYDVNDAGPEDKQRAMAYAHTVRGNAWDELCFVTAGSDRESGGARKFVRSSLEFEQTDRLSDQCSVFISVDGAPAQALGEVWVEYEVELFTPQLEFVPNGSSVVEQASGQALATSLLKGLTKTRSECQTLYGADCKIDDGVITFFSPFAGTMVCRAVSGSALGSCTLEGGADLSVPGAKGERPEVLTTALMSNPGGAGTPLVYGNAILAWPGSKLNLKPASAGTSTAASMFFLNSINGQSWLSTYGNSPKTQLTGL